jgi:hypothetical protein
VRLEDTRSELEKRLAGLDPCGVQEGIAAMLSFYRDTRVERCDVAADGDMLLFQWGTDRAAPLFTVNITRQLATAGGSFLDRIHRLIGWDEPELWQLGLTFAFEGNFEELGASNDWCHRPSELPNFEEKLNASKVLAAVRGIAPTSIEVTFENAE